jgi:hypothetical protein
MFFYIFFFFLEALTNYSENNRKSCELINSVIVFTMKVLNSMYLRFPKYNFSNDKIITPYSV